MQHHQARKADLWSGLFWIVFGGATIAHSTTMPIPRHLGATLLTGPGLVPALLGAGLALLGVVLVIRSLRGSVILGAEAEADPSTLSNGRALLALVLMVAYAGSIATRQPFVPSTILFITAFVTAFNWEGRRWTGRAKVAAGALVLSVATGFAVEFVFESIFFVRLP